MHSRSCHNTTVKGKHIATNSIIFTLTAFMSVVTIMMLLIMLTQLAGVGLGFRVRSCCAELAGNSVHHAF